MDPAYKREYDNFEEPLPPNPDWIEIEGFGKVTRAEVLAGELIYSKLFVRLGTGSGIAYQLLPLFWLQLLSTRQ